MAKPLWKLTACATMSVGDASTDRELAVAVASTKKGAKVLLAARVRALPHAPPVYFIRVERVERAARVTST